MKKVLLALTMVGVLVAAFYFAGRSPATAPYTPPAVAESPNEFPPTPAEAEGTKYPMINTARMKRWAEMPNKKGPSPIEDANNSDWMMAAKKIKANDRVPASK